MSQHLIETVDARQRMHFDRVVACRRANLEVGDSDVAEPTASAEANTEDEGVGAAAARQRHVGYQACATTNRDHIVTASGVNEDVLHRAGSDAERGCTIA